MAILDKINLDFQVINTGDPKVLFVVDTSIWGFIEDKPAIIEIIVPGSSKVKVYNFVKGNNVFNSSNLLLSPVGEFKELPDGIYRITIKGSPDSFCTHRDFMKTDKVKLELAKIYISLGFEDTDKVKEKKRILQDFDLLIRASEYAAKIGQLKRAHTYLKKVTKYINDYNECSECQHNQ